MFVGEASQESVGCVLNLWKESELLPYARPDVVEIFPRLEKPDDSRVARRFLKVLKPPVVPVNNIPATNQNCYSISTCTMFSLFSGVSYVISGPYSTVVLVLSNLYL